MNDPALRDAFLTRIFAYERLRALQRRVESGMGGVGDLVAHHAREKYLLYAYRPETLRELGRLVAGAARRPLAEVVSEYAQRVMETLEHPPTRGRHLNALQHLAGYLRGHVQPDCRAELHDALWAYRRGESPRAVPLALLKHHVRRAALGYVAQQTYLNPYPAALIEASASV